MSEKYRVFISFKNKDENDEKTLDSQIAQKVFSKLSSKGIKTFYSNVTLLEFGEAAYKEAIEQALEEAMVLLVIGSNESFLNARWIRYEWNSFHEDILSEDKKDGIIVPYVSELIERKNRPRAIRNYETFFLEADPIEKVVDFIVSHLRKVDPEIGRISKKVDFASLGSTYDPSSGNEFNRLKIQAKNTRDADVIALKHCMDKIPNSKINVLDVGCSYGFVETDRFLTFPDKSIDLIGVDFNQKCINYANEHNNNPCYSYHNIDIESTSFEQRLNSIIEKRDIHSFDIILITLVLHHLKDPVKFLRRIRKYLSPNGFLFVRGSDDGTVIAYNDNGLVQKILDKHHAVSGISDRFNGRKIYYQLFSSGYKNICSFSSIKDLSGKSYEERQDIFEERFAYRINNISNLLNLDPTNMQLMDDYGWMEYALDQLSNTFGDPSFWYQEIDFLYTATK